MNIYKCRYCKKELKENDTYEYRGVYSCAQHFDLVSLERNRERQDIIDEENSKTECFHGLDLSSDTIIGRTNRKILKSQLELASKESKKLNTYKQVITVLIDIPLV